MIFNQYFNKILNNKLIKENNWVRNHYSTDDTFRNSLKTHIINYIKKLIKKYSDNVDEQKKIIEKAQNKIKDKSFKLNSSGNYDTLEDKLIGNIIKEIDNKTKTLVKSPDIVNKTFKNSPKHFYKLYDYALDDILSGVLHTLSESDNSDNDQPSDNSDDKQLHDSSSDNIITKNSSTTIHKILQLIKQLNGNNIDKYIIKILQLIKQLNNNDNDKYIKNILQLISQLNNTNDDNNANVNSGWILKCFKRRSPKTSNKQYVTDLYRPVDENFTKQLKDKLGIDYFAFEYTSAEPNTMERVTKAVWDANKYTQMLSCRFMAFDETNKPLTQFGVANVTLNRGDNKTTFILKNGSIPHIQTPDRQFSDKQFVDIIKNSLPLDIKENADKLGSIYDEALKVIFNDLKSQRSSSGNNLGDILLMQYATKIQDNTSKLNKFFGSIIGDLIDIIQSNKTDTNTDTNNQQILATFKTQLQSNNLYQEIIKLLKENA